MYRFFRWAADDYFDALDIKLVTGPLLDREVTNDSNLRTEVAGETRSISNVVINMTAVSAFGWSRPANSIGEGIHRWPQYFTIAGVIEDAYFSSLKSPVEPMVFRLDNSRNEMLIEIYTGEVETALDTINTVWDRHIPDYLIQLSMLQGRHSAACAAEERTFNLLLTLAAIAIVMSSAGLYAMAAFLAELRAKEVGIRKVVIEEM